VKDKQNPTQPSLQALLLADHVYKDANSGKFVIAGTFRQLWAHEFPTNYTREVYVYVALSGIRSKTKLLVRFVDLSNLEVLFQSPEVGVDGDDPLATLEFCMALPGLPMPHPGAFAVELAADFQTIGSVRVDSGLLPRQDGQAPGGPGGPKGPSTHPTPPPAGDPDAN
jgi:hypothetical protein